MVSVHYLVENLKRPLKSVKVRDFRLFRALSALCFKSVREQIMVLRPYFKCRAQKSLQNSFFKKAKCSMMLAFLAVIPQTSYNT